MKQIITNNKDTILIDDIDESDFLNPKFNVDNGYGRVYGVKAITGKVGYLRYEASGYIFRYIDCPSGFCGHSPTVKDAIKRAMLHGNVYQFKSMKELFDNLVNKN